MLTRDALIAPKTKTVKVEGGEIVIRKLRAAEAIELRGKELTGPEIFKLIADSMTEPAVTVEDVGQFTATDMNKILFEVFAFNGLGESAVAEARDELKKTTR
jgi:hypothetical protein